jgi:hypothetical protein
LVSDLLSVRLVDSEELYAFLFLARISDESPDGYLDHLNSDSLFSVVLREQPEDCF